jgi:CRP-like cAMP-binding protein
VAELERILRGHPFFAEMDGASCDFLAGCAAHAEFGAGDYLFHAGAAADRFYLLRAGRVALETKAPGRGAVAFQTLEPGEIVGVSWLVPPYRWSYDARAVAPTRAVALDAACLRDRCEADPRLGYALMKRFVPVLVERLQATRLQILDVYGPAG